jgi:hypothetical protein
MGGKLDRKKNYQIMLYLSRNELSATNKGAKTDLTVAELRLFWRSRQLYGYSRASYHSVETEGLFPCSQEPSSGHYPKADQSCHPRHQPIYVLFFQVVSFLLAFSSIT